MTLIRNAWYVAGFSEEIAEGEMVPRRILGDHILLLRRSGGDLAAMIDRCPHRFAPLSLGQFDGETVTCRYHGLGFGADGKCSHNPHGPNAGLRVESWPVVEDEGLIWVWPGDADKSRDAAPPRFELDTDTHHVRHGYIHGNADYRLMVDNILDLSHIEFLHPLLGTQEVRNAAVEVTATDGAITVSRAMKGETLADGLAFVYGSRGEQVDRTLTVEWTAPSNMLLSVGIEKPSGATGSRTLHLFTPETASSTHYFYVSSMARQNATVEQFDAFADALARVFNSEDKPMIDAQQQRIGAREFSELRPALLRIDKAAVLARRTLERMAAAEAGAA